MDAPEDSASEVVRESRRLIRASRLLVEAAHRTTQTAVERLERARNIVQAFWLWREIHKRRLGR